MLSSTLALLPAAALALHAGVVPPQHRCAARARIPHAQLAATFDLGATWRTSVC